MRKGLGGILLGLGCAATFLGLLALVLPGIDNPQLQLVLASFAVPSSDLFVGAVNRAMQFAFANALPLLLTGLGAAAAGIVLLLCFGRREEPVIQRHAPRQTPSESGNPFAAASPGFGPRLTQQPQKEEKPFAYFPPILERNADLTAYERPSQPSPFARPESEMPAQQPIEEPRLVPVAPVKAETESQSGGRLIIRSDFSQPQPKAPDQPEMEKPEPLPAAEADDAPAESEPYVSPRIRTTMGKHTL